MPHVAIVQIKGLTPYSQSKPHQTEKLNKESPDDFEKRTWKEKLHYDEQGIIFIPPMAFKNCIAEAAKYLGKKIPGKRGATYTKHFEAGVLVTDPSLLGIHKDLIVGDWIFTPSDGVKGSGKRVHKCFPIIPPGWQAKVEFLILDDIITEGVFVEHLEQAGQLIGIGRFRPRNGGYYGRFVIEKFDWKQMS
ncbi:hypothetical protein [Iningainema tapete]|uniref:Uncharacterized protein n=1 Tax=Iningainema tapete BLCC-T55 TaxID=2748662 RepID=A0A8J6XAE7_9CYAN|nr:hypothetical protein [Iningainema tapete]MBD2771155.1 hypothetical protein [Iningainema tapete BLCC-T55]